MTRTRENLITKAQAAERAGVHRATIDRLRKAGKLTTYRELGDRSVLIDPEELDALKLRVVPAQRKGADA